MNTYLRVIVTIIGCVWLPKCLFAQELGTTKLNQLIRGTGKVVSFAVSPNGQHVVFLARLNSGDPTQLYRVSPNGGSVTRLNSDLVSASAQIKSFQISPDSSMVVYAGNQENIFYDGIYSVPINGGQVNQLNRRVQDVPLVRPGPSLITNFRISPDSRSVVFLQDYANFRQNWLYSNSIDGNINTTVLLNDTQNLQSQPNFSFKISQDSERVVYTVNAQGSGSSGGPFKLYSTPIGSRNLTAITTSAQAGNRQAFDISPDSQRIVFTAESNGNGVFRLYSKPISGGAAMPLSPLASDNAFAFMPRVTPDSARVIFVAASTPADSFTERTLYSVPVVGGSATQLSPSASNSRDVDRFFISNDGSRIVYSNKRRSLFSTPSSSMAPTPLTSSLPASARIDSVGLSADGNYVVYKAKQMISAPNMLFSVPVAGGVIEQLNGALENNDEVRSFKITERGRRVVFSVGPRSSNQSSALFTVQINGDDPVVLNQPLVTGGSINRFSINEAVNAVIYHGDTLVDGRDELFAVDMPVTEDDALCIPIKVQNANVALICL